MRTRTLGLAVTPSFAALVLAVLAATAAPAVAQTQFAPYYGKNAIRYDHFRWQTYQTDHFEIYFYDEIEPHLERMAGYAESAYQHISSELKHDLAGKVPLILFQTSAEFYQQNVIPGAAQEGVGAFAEPSRYRILMPMDEPPDLLYRLMVHELTHIFQFDIIPTSLIRSTHAAVGERGHVRLHDRRVEAARHHDGARRRHRRRDPADEPAAGLRQPRQPARHLQPRPRRLRVHGSEVGQGGRPPVRLRAAQEHHRRRRRRLPWRPSRSRPRSGTSSSTAI